MKTIDVMLSSTVYELLKEREAVQSAFQDIPFVKLVGAQPFNDTSVSSSSYQYTQALAKDCNLYILILGEKFGFETITGESATELEFDSAYLQDPTKILVFQKENTNGVRQRKQKKFVDKVTNYYSGFWRTTYKETDELVELVKKSFYEWLFDRSAIGQEMTYLDHFIRLANKLKPEPNSQLVYRVTSDDIELEYSYFTKTQVIHISRKNVFENFWGEISNLQSSLKKIQKGK